MTGYTVNTGSNKKFSDGWDRIFPGAKTSAARPKKATAAKAAAKPGKKTPNGK